MAANLALDDKLLEQARRIGGHKTKREAVTAALREYVRYRRQREVTKHFGTVDFDPSPDYQSEKNRKRGWRSLNKRADPVLAELWDNPRDAAYDKL